MKKVIAGVGLGFICMVSSAETMDFTAMGGYADGMLNTHSDWNGSAGFRVNAAIPDCRLHDANWTGSNVADIPFVFPLAYCRDQKVPLDFCSQHAYNAKPLAVKNNAILTQEALDKFGFSEAEIFITEWHYWNGSWSQLYDYDDPEYHVVKFAELNGPAAPSLLLIRLTAAE